jgi:hypothetical protein
MRSEGRGSRLATAGLALARSRARRRAERQQGGGVAKHRRGDERWEERERVVQGARHGTSAWRAEGREARRREGAPEPGGLEWMSCHAVRLVQHASWRDTQTGLYERGVKIS